MSARHLGFPFFFAGGSPSSYPGWLLRSGAVYPDLDIDFTQDLAWNNSGISIALLLSCARATPANASYENAAGVVSYFSTDTLRYGNNGLLIEASKTNVVVQSRNLANAAWTALNLTVVNNQIGPDGVVNSASLLTATAGNGTLLQAIVLASSARFQTAYIKRITGTGVINMTMDAGVTWGVVTATAAWTRVSIPTQTLANPTVGFRIVTSGDAVAIAFVQNEDSTFATSYIPTTTAAVTRVGDTVVLDNALLSATFYQTGTWYIKFVPNAVAYGMYLIAKGGGAAEIVITGNGDDIASYDGATEINLAGGSNIIVGSEYRAALAFSGSERLSSVNGAAFGTHAYDGAFDNADVGIGGRTDAVTSNMTGYVKRIAFWSTELTGATIQTLTT